MPRSSGTTDNLYNGTFSSKTVSYFPTADPWAVAAADLDGDELDDLLVTDAIKADNPDYTGPRKRLLVAGLLGVVPTARTRGSDFEKCENLVWTPTLRSNDSRGG